MAAFSHLRFPLSNRTLFPASSLGFSNPKSNILFCFSSSASSPSSHSTPSITTQSSSPPPSYLTNHHAGDKWESVRKKKVEMRVRYVGTDYRGRFPHFCPLSDCSCKKINTLCPMEQQTITKFYFLVANAKFMLDEEEHFQEQLFERLGLYGERNKEHDFWLVIEPKFLDKFPNITKRLKRPAVALVSTNGPWITFMKLRLDRVLSESYEADSLEEALASNPVNIEFEKPEKWVAPYPKYERGWWERFLPPGYSMS